METKDFYCEYADVPNHKEISAEVLAHVEHTFEEGLKNLSNRSIFFRMEMPNIKPIREMLDKCPVLESFLKDRKLRIKEIDISCLKPRGHLYIHADWFTVDETLPSPAGIYKHPNDGSNIALNFNLKNAEDTEVEVFRVKKGHEYETLWRASDARNNYYPVWNREDVEVVKTHNLKNPAFLCVSKPHQAINNTDSPRIVLSLRFMSDPRETINYLTI